jgi:hypothetical protein
MKMLRLFSKKANGMPATAPLRKKRFVGRTERGSMAFQKHKVPHADPAAADRIAVSLMIFFERLFTAEIG